MNNAEEQTSDLEDRIMEITQPEQQTERQIKKWKQYMRPMEWYKACQSTHTRNARRWRREKRIETKFTEMMAKNFPNLITKEISKYRKHSESQTIWTQTNLH